MNWSMNSELTNQAIIDIEWTELRQLASTTPCVRVFHQLRRYGKPNTLNCACFKALINCYRQLFYNCQLSMYSYHQSVCILVIPWLNPSICSSTMVLVYVYHTWGRDQKCRAVVYKWYSTAKHISNIPRHAVVASIYGVSSHIPRNLMP